jgi:oxazoline/thiazoline synthase
MDTSTPDPFILRMPVIDTSRIPRLRPSLHVATVERDCAYIVSERKAHRLSGESLVVLLQAIDGIRSVPELVEYLDDQLSPAEVIYLIEQLFARGYLIDASSDACDDGRSAFRELMGWHARAPFSVSLHTLGTGVDHALAVLLGECGIDVAAQGTLAICLVDDYLNPELTSLVHGIDGPVLLAKTCGTRLLIGPVIGSDGGFCLNCLQFWLRHNRPVQSMLERRTGSTLRLPPVNDPAGKAIAGGLVALAIRRYATGDRSLLHGLESLDLASMQTTKHEPARRPQCAACGNPQWMHDQATRSVDLRASSRQALSGGSYRTLASAETLQRYQHLVDPLCGPVAYLHPMPGRHHGERKVYVSGYLVCPTAPDSGNPFDKICAGKGETDDDARASALCEALERFSSVFQGDESRVRTSARALGTSAISLASLQHFSDRQIQRRSKINADTRDRRRQVPEPLPEEATIDWTPAWCLNDGSHRLVPLIYCFAETPADSGHLYGIYNPNGTAAGNDLAEAILQGLLELIERDAVAIWWYNRLHRPAAAPTSMADPWFTRMKADYDAAGWRLWVLDLTHDLRIPVCAALAHHEQQDRYAIGFGCHLSTELAAKRAVTELNQLLDPSMTAPSPWDRSLLEDPSFLEAADTPAICPQAFTKTTLPEHIEQCVATLAQAGMSAFVVNKSRPDIGLSVVQTIVPGLRHFWPRLGAGRLYDVPVQLGWLTKPTPEVDLNPAPLFL